MLILRIFIANPEGTFGIFGLYPFKRLRSKMKLTFVSPAFILSSLITGHISVAHGKMLLPLMLSGMFFKTNNPETPAKTNLSAVEEAAVLSDKPAAGDDLVASKISGSEDLVPKPEVVRELVEEAEAKQGTAGQDGVMATETDVQAAKAEVATEKIVSAASENAKVTAAPQESAVNAQNPVNVEKQQLTEEDAAKNSELLQSVGSAAEASWVSNVSRESAIEAMLPLVALTPVLAAAGFHADIETSSSGAPLVRFPSIDYAVEVTDLLKY